jgi:hypothetical protein
MRDCQRGEQNTIYDNNTNFRKSVKKLTRYYSAIIVRVTKLAQFEGIANTRERLRKLKSEITPLHIYFPLLDSERRTLLTRKLANKLLKRKSLSKFPFSTRFPFGNYTCFTPANVNICGCKTCPDGGDRSGQFGTYRVFHRPLFCGQVDWQVVCVLRCVCFVCRMA